MRWRPGHRQVLQHRPPAWQWVPTWQRRSIPNYTNNTQPNSPPRCYHWTIVAPFSTENNVTEYFATPPKLLWAIESRVGKCESRERDPLLALIAVDSRECVIAGRPCSYYNNNPIATECMYIALATIFEVNHSILCDRCAHFVPSTTTATTTPFNSHEQQFNATREIALYYVEQRAK